MCRVNFVNQHCNYTDYNNAQIETDIPTEMIPVFQKVFNDLNKSRTNAICPFISITEET